MALEVLQVQRNLSALPSLPVRRVRFSFLLLPSAGNDVEEWDGMEGLGFGETQLKAGLIS